MEYSALVVITTSRSLLISCTFAVGCSIYPTQDAIYPTYSAPRRLSLDHCLVTSPPVPSSRSLNPRSPWLLPLARALFPSLSRPCFFSSFLSFFLAFICNHLPPPLKPRTRLARSYLLSSSLKLNSTVQPSSNAPRTVLLSHNICCAARKRTTFKRRRCLSLQELPGVPVPHLLGLLV